MTYRILVGLPSWNEADTIAKVTTDIDAGLATAPFAVETVFVNADNSSTDGTPDAFLAASTRGPKSVITTPHAGGKGSNWRALLRRALDEGVDAILFVDTDLAEVPESWTHALLGGVRDGVDFCFPRRPPTWNGGDLTYHLAYPALASVFGADLAEPLCGDLALSGRAAAQLLEHDWSPAEHRFGVDFLIATVAIANRWDAIPLADRRRNKLRSFSTRPGGEYRMGGKFADVATTIGLRVGRRIREPAPDTFTTTSAPPPTANSVVVPDHDPDIAELARSTSRRLRTDLNDQVFDVFPPSLAHRLVQHIRDGAERGLSWPDWRDCLFHWVREHRTPKPTVPIEILETLFLNRVVGHHREIAGTVNWYDTVRDQAQDAFTHRHRLWA